MKKILSAILILVLYAQCVVAQDGSVDVSFNSTTQQLATNSNFNNNIFETYVFPNGEYLVCGAFTELNGQSANRLVRLDQQGDIIAGFAAGAGPDGTVNGMLILTNGKILIYGLFTTYDGVPSPRIAMLNADGSRDNGFQMTNPFMEIQESLELPDGRILIGGLINNNPVIGRIIRITNEGTIDTDFEVSVNSSIKELTTDATGAIYACGQFTMIGGVSRNKIAKLSFEGIVDLGYEIPVAYTMNTEDILVHSDGTLVLSCSASVGGQYGRFRFFPNGTPDPSFSGATYALNNFQVEIDDQGRYLFLVKNNVASWVERFNNDGSPDENFEIQLFSLCANRSHMTLEPGGKILISGNANQFAFCFDGLKRLEENGRIDASFMPSKGSDRPIRVVKTLPDGKILLGGNFYGFNGVSNSSIIRLLNNGDVDMSFNSGIGAAFRSDAQSDILINAIEVQADGKIIIGGDFDLFDGYNYKKLVRLHPNGSVDTSFHIGNGFSGAVESILAQPDGRIIVSGTFYYYDQYGANFTSANGCIRLLENGLPDITFLSNVMSGYAHTIKLLPNGHLLLGGSIATYSGISVHNIIRINQNGQLDNTFNYNTGSIGTVYDLAFQEDGKLIVATSGNTINGQIQPTLYRFLTNGSLDNTFIPGGMNQEVDSYQIEIQPDGKILVLATEELYEMHFNIFRLMPDGQQDLTFNTLDYADNDMSLSGIKSFGLQPDGRIIAGGQFNTCDGVLSNNIVRLNNSIALSDCQYFGAQIESVSNITCGGGIGQITAFAQNGASPYSYSWDNSPLNVDDTIFTTESAGIHYLSVADTSGCTYSTGFLVNGPLSQIDDRIVVVTGGFRPGFSNGTILEVLNSGCPLSAGTLRFIKDPLLTLQLSTPPPVSISGDTLFWEYNELAIDSSHFIVHLVFETSTSAIIGDQIHFNVSVDPLGIDSDTINNVFVNAFQVINGYDPNDKKVYPVGECIPGYIRNGEKLTYTVRFQNTGNSEAINIHILDSISEYLNIHSLRILGSSHSMHTEILSNSLVNFVFNNIQLPDSISDESGSQGYIVYEIEQQTYLYDESEIKNRAAIYFDFNPPIITNEVLNTIIDHDPNVTGDTLLVTVDETFLWHGTTYNESGIYTTHFSTPELCDSAIFLNLNVTHNSYSTLIINACDEWYSPSGDQLWTSSGTYFDTIVNTFGADSIITINLTITTLNTMTELTDELNIMALEENATYQWLDCIAGFSLIPGATFSNFTAQENGSYAIQLTANGCVDTSACLSITSVGIITFDQLTSVYISPNPTTGYLLVEIPQSFQIKGWKLSQLSGHVVLAGGSTLDNFELYIEGDSGMYFLWLEFDTGEVARLPIVLL